MKKYSLDSREGGNDIKRKKMVEHGNDRRKKYIAAGMTIIMICFLAVSLAAKSKLPYDNTFLPGDKVCIYDIHKDDALVDNYNDSLKHWDRSEADESKREWRLRTSVRKLLLAVMQPGLTRVQDLKTKEYWYSGELVVVDGGYRPKAKAKTYLITRGENELFGQLGVSWVLNWQIVKFEKARFKKKGFLSCARKYPKF